MRLAVWTALMCLFLMPWAQAASFDCTKASTFVEKAICSDQQLSAMDDELGRLYKRALASGSNNAMLKMDEKAWLSLRNQCQDSDCLKEAYAYRIDVLGGTSYTGMYKMENGEVLVQQTATGRIKFYINATFHTNVGELSGEVPLIGDVANYVDKELECALSFKFAPSGLVVTQDGSCGWGLNVSGSGTYKRVSHAPPKFDE